MQPSSSRSDDDGAQSLAELCDVQIRLRAAFDLSFVSGSLAHALSNAADVTRLRAQLALSFDSALTSGSLASAVFATSDVAALGQEADGELPVPLELVSDHVSIGAISNMVGTQSSDELSRVVDDIQLRAKLALCLDSALKSGSLASAVFATSDVAAFWQEADGEPPSWPDVESCYGNIEIVQVQSSVVNVAELTHSLFSPPRSNLSTSCALPFAEDGANCRVAQALRLTASKIQNNFERLQVVEEFRSSLYRICSELAENRQLPTFLEAHRRFDEFRQIVLSPNDPQILTGPFSCKGMFCEATLRNRTGIGGARYFCNEVMASTITDIAEECAALSNLCQTTHNLSQAVMDHLGSNAEGVFRTFTACDNSGRSDEWERTSIGVDFLQDKLALTTFSDHILKLEALPSKISRVHTAVADTITRIDFFMEKAPKDVYDACQMPFPLSAFQRMIVGSNPPLVEMLLGKLSYVETLDFKSVSTKLGKLAKDLGELPFETVLQVLKSVAAKEGIRMGKLRIDPMRRHVHDMSDDDDDFAADVAFCRLRNLLSTESRPIVLAEGDPMEPIFT